MNLIRSLTNTSRRMTTTDLNPARMRDVVGRLKVSRHQNIYDADFEYGTQPLRWESLTAGGGAVTHQPGLGGVRMQVDTANGSLAIRQSRPYHRYQPGKTMFMATAALFGIAEANNVQRVGFFDDGNGIFFEQATPTAGNPSGMFCATRTDVSGVPVDTRYDLANWSGDDDIAALLDWTRIQMLFIEYAWYGAGALRWGVFLNGEPYVLHQVGIGNLPGQTAPWSRTGNLPVRYETRNTAAPAQANSLTHYGVSVIVEGGVDEQRGFTYGYGMAAGTPRRTVASNTTRFPVLSIRARTMGVIEFSQANSAITAGTTTSVTLTGTPLTANQYRGRAIFFPSLALTARITGNTSSVVSFADIVTGQPLAVAPTAGIQYQIGLINRGQLLPRRLMVSASALGRIELIASTPSSPIVLTGANFQALSGLGSANSFAERDVSATAMTGGEVVFPFTSPAGGSGLQDIELRDLFPLLNTVRGNTPDILTVAVSTPGSGASDVGADLICQEAMS
jgi:hypothetical protein